MRSVRTPPLLTLVDALRAALVCPVCGTLRAVLCVRGAGLPCTRCSHDTRLTAWLCRVSTRSADHLIDYVADVCYAADELKWDKFSILGHSLGGSVGCFVAATWPERCASKLASLCARHTPALPSTHATCMWLRLWFPG